MNLYLSPTGKLALRNNIGSVTTTSTTVIPKGGWHQVVLHQVGDGTASRVDVSLDGTPVSDLSLTGQKMGTILITILQMGDTATGRTYDIDFDDISVSPRPLSDHDHAPFLAGVLRSPRRCSSGRWQRGAPADSMRVLKFEYVTLASNADRTIKALHSLLERCCYIGVRANMS